MIQGKGKDFSLSPASLSQKLCGTASIEHKDSSKEKATKQVPGQIIRANMWTREGLWIEKNSFSYFKHLNIVLDHWSVSSSLDPFLACI